MTATDGVRDRIPRIGRQIVDLMVLTAGGIGLALPLILPLG